jgi:hypothetical protein
MKTCFNHLIRAYQGKCDGLVYYYHPGLDKVVARRHVIPRASSSNARFGSIAANLKALAPSEGYKADLKVYMDLCARSAASPRRPRQNWMNAFTSLMWGLAHSFSREGNPLTGAGGPGQTPIDLATLTREDIYANSLPCASVKQAVEAGLLEAVNGWELLTRMM